MNANQYGVEVGQIWADNDSRSEGRTVRIVTIERTHAVAEVLTNTDDVQEILSGQRVLTWYQPKDKRGSLTRIRLDRFKPTSTGYRLISDGSS